MDIHFAPIWGKNTPKFGIAHALAIGVIYLLILQPWFTIFFKLGPWLAVEIPMMIEEGKITKKWGFYVCTYTFSYYFSNKNIPLRIL